jgi:hypothetical protein
MILGGLWPYRDSPNRGARLMSPASLFRNS